LDAMTSESYAALALVGTMASTLSDASFVRIGTLPIQGSLARTLHDVTVEASSSDSPVMLPSLAATLDDATAAAVGNFFATASVDYTLASATCASAGALALQAAISQVLDGASMAATARLAIAGTLANTLDTAVVASVMLASPG